MPLETKNTHIKSLQYSSVICDAYMSFSTGIRGIPFSNEPEWAQWSQRKWRYNLQYYKVCGDVLWLPHGTLHQLHWSKMKILKLSLETKNTQYTSFIDNGHIVWKYAIGHMWTAKVCTMCYMPERNIQSTLVISNSKGLTETLRDIRTSTYQGWESEEDNKLNNHI